MSDGSLEILNQPLVSQLERNNIVVVKELSPAQFVALSQANEGVDLIEVEIRLSFPTGVVRQPPRIDVPSIGLPGTVMRDRACDLVAASAPGARFWVMR